MIAYDIHTTPAGELLLIAQDGRLLGAHWTVSPHAPQTAADWQAEATPFAAIKQQLAEYFAGRRTMFDVDWHPAIGTPFQQAVWREIAAIPFGGSKTYGELAAAVGRPRAVRAVGSAVGRNPLSIVVPCHRVLGTARGLGGYAGGLASKTTLLTLEGIHFRPHKEQA